MYQTSEPSYQAVAAEYCARNLGAVAVDPVERIVTPAPCAKVTCPAPFWIKSILDPAA